MVRRAAMAGAVLAVTLAACGGGGDDDTETGADDADQPAASDEGAADSGDFCSDLEALVTTNIGIMMPLLGEDPTGLQTAVTEAEAAYPDLAVAAEASAPTELAADVVTVTDATQALIDALAGIDVSDSAALGAAVDGAMTSDMDEAADRLSEHARTECGFDPDAADDGLGEAAASGTAAEPPDACAFVDPQVVVDAAGVDADVTDHDGGGNVNLGVYATDGCSYGNGAVSISTITFGGDPAEVVQSHVDSAEDNGGRVVTDVELGTLPAESTVITEVHGYTSITVLDAPVAFTVGIEDVVDPAALVAAAEAVVAATA